MTCCKIILLFVLSISAHAGVDDGVDYVEVAKVLIKDGYVDRAESTLKKVNIETDAVEFGDYWFVKGVISLHRKNYQEALVQLDKAYEESKDTEVYLYQAEAYFRLENYSKALSTVNKVKKKTPAYYVLKSSVFWQQQEREKAWSVLNQARLQKVMSARLSYKKQFSLLMEAGLFHAAQEFSIAHLGHFVASDMVAIAQVFREKKRYHEAIRVLESSRLRWLYDEKLNMELAANYLQIKNQFTASLIVEEVSRVHRHLSHEASELLRSSRQSYRVAFQERNLQDPGKRLKQKLAIYLQTEKYGLVAKMTPLLKDTELLGQEDIRYAVAYAFYKTGQFKKSNFHLNQVTRADLFEKATELRIEMDKCSKNRWLCRALL